MIYFIQNETTRAIKIGYSKDVKGRLSALQTSSCDRLRLMGVIPGNTRDEGELHKRFEKHRIVGEWFRPDEGILRMISDALKTHQSKGFHDAYWGTHYEPLVPMLTAIVSRVKGFNCECASINIPAMRALYSGQDPDLKNNRSTWRYEPLPEEEEPQEFADAFWSSEIQWQSFNTPIEAAFFFLNLQLGNP